MRARSACLLLMAAGAAFAAEAALPYFSQVREVRPAAAGRQNYLVVDADTWSRARMDLGDLRLYHGQQQVPYGVVVKRAERRAGVTVTVSSAILNLGSAAGQTQFVVRVPVDEYNQLRLDLDARDFVAHATVEGHNDMRAASWTRLGTFTLYDFSREGLGASSTVKLPASNFRYLRIRIAGPVRPGQVKSVGFANRQESSETWTDTGIRPEIRQEGRETVVRWEQPRNVPVERIRFETSDVNFHRRVTASTDAGPVAAGEIRRVKMVRAGREIDTSEMTLRTSFRLSGPAKVEIKIDNGDNPPLRLTAVRLEMRERRLYFVPEDDGPLSLYFGDAKLATPEYDFAKLFREETDAAAATLGPVRENPVYAGRPDDRPWSERHPAVLWTALLVAIGGLGLVAWRALRV